MNPIVNQLLALPAGAAAYGLTACAEIAGCAISTGPALAIETGADDRFVMMSEGNLDPTRSLRAGKGNAGKSASTNGADAPEPDEPGVIQKLKTAFDPREWRWKSLEKGHGKPWRTYKDSEKAEKRIIDSELVLLLKQYPFINLGALEAGLIENRETSKSEDKYPVAVIQNEALMARALSWMDADYLGAKIFTRLSENEPVLVTFVPESGGILNMIGAYHLGTNCIHTDYSLFRTPDVTGKRIVQITHELHHFAAWLGGGMGMRWRDEAGAPRFRRGVKFPLGNKVVNEPLSDCLTEMLSHQLAFENGADIRPSHPGKYALLGLIIQEIAGRDETRSAYFSGDYTGVRKRLDDALGNGAFVRMLDILDKGYYHITDALEFIIGMIDEGGVEIDDYSEEGLGKIMFDDREELAEFLPSAYRIENREPADV